VIYFTKTSSNVVSSFLEVIEWLLERVSKLSLETRCCPSDLSVGFSHTANDAGQSFGSENH